MRHVLALVVLGALLAAPSLVPAKDCPADARKASLALWPGGSIRTGRSVTGMHPCGRQLTCVGGVPGNFSSRECRWE